MGDICNITYNAVLTNGEALAAYCASNSPDCYGICANSDLAGIGVRAAFYAQAGMNALLIIFSPEDAASGAWASTILTGALVIPAMILKLQRSLSLHHSVLVLNFATLSTVASLASAPMVPIWRGSKKRVLRNRIAEAKRQEEELKKTQGRKILSYAVLTQIILQWAFTVLLFVDPYYNQTPCSGSTIIVFPGGTLTADEINAHHFGVWAFWLLICASASMFWGAVMVFSCRSTVHDEHVPIHMHIPEDADFKTRWTLYGQKLWLMVPPLDPKHDDLYWARWGIRASKLCGSVVVLVYATLIEVQRTKNNVLPGESAIWSFSQTAAVLLALAPLWPILIAWLTPAHHALPLHNGHAPQESTLYQHGGPPPSPPVQSPNPSRPPPSAMPDGPTYRNRSYDNDKDPQEGFGTPSLYDSKGYGAVATNDYDDLDTTPTPELEFPEAFSPGTPNRYSPVGGPGSFHSPGTPNRYSPAGGGGHGSRLGTGSTSRGHASEETAVDGLYGGESYNMQQLGSTGPRNRTASSSSFVHVVTPPGA